MMVLTALSFVVVKVVGRVLELEEAVTNLINHGPLPFNVIDHTVVDVDEAAVLAKIRQAQSQPRRRTRDPRNDG